MVNPVQRRSIFITPIAMKSLSLLSLPGIQATSVCLKKSLNARFSAQTATEKSISAGITSNAGAEPAPCYGAISGFNPSLRINSLLKYLVPWTSRNRSLFASLMLL